MRTSPVPFAPLDVGVALSGRDTGSSQIFVVLARHPPLDGQYAWVGRADGDWNAVAEGDIVHAVHVEFRERRNLIAQRDSQLSRKRHSED